MYNPLQHDLVEFYLDKERTPFCRVRSSFQPNDEDIVSIRGKNYRVLGISFSVDYADDPH